MAVLDSPQHCLKRRTINFNSWNINLLVAASKMINFISDFLRWSLLFWLYLFRLSHLKMAPIVKIPKSCKQKPTRTQFFCVAVVFFRDCKVFLLSLHRGYVIDNLWKKKSCEAWQLSFVRIFSSLSCTLIHKNKSNMRHVISKPFSPHLPLSNIINECCRVC